MSDDVQFKVFRRWLVARAKMHRDTERLSPTQEGAVLCACRAREGEEIIEAIGDYWLGPLPTDQKEGPGVDAPEPTSPRKRSGPIARPSPTKAT